MSCSVGQSGNKSLCKKKVDYNVEPLFQLLRITWLLADRRPPSCPRQKTRMTGKRRSGALRSSSSCCDLWMFTGRVIGHDQQLITQLQQRRRRQRQWCIVRCSVHHPLRGATSCQARQCPSSEQRLMCLPVGPDSLPQVTWLPIEWNGKKQQQMYVFCVKKYVEISPIQFFSQREDGGEERQPMGTLGWSCTPTPHTAGPVYLSTPTLTPGQESCWVPVGFCKHCKFWSQVK